MNDLAGFPLPTGGNPGLIPYRNVAVTNAAAAVLNGQGAVYGYTFRNPNTTAVFVNIYAAPSSRVTVGSAAAQPVLVKRVYVPAAISAGIPGEKIISVGSFPIVYGPAGISIAAITTDSDTGSTAPSSAIYAEMDVVGMNN